MIFSRSIAKKRIAAGERPGWLAAWWPVLADGLSIIAVLALISPFLGMVLAEAGNLPSLTFIAILFVVYFIPFQAVLILSTIWAVKSSWQDDADREP